MKYIACVLLCANGYMCHMANCRGKLLITRSSSDITFLAFHLTFIPFATLYPSSEAQLRQVSRPGAESLSIRAGLVEPVGGQDSKYEMPARPVPNPAAPLAIRRAVSARVPELLGSK